MALDVYTNLKTAITDTLDRSDLTDHVDDFIDIAEARHKRDVRLQEMLTRAALTVDDRFIALPTRFLEALTLRLLTDPVTVLTEVNLHEMNRRRKESTGKPSVFATHATFEFDRDPDTAYSGEIIYYQELTALSDANVTNSLLDRAPDAYLYAALAASAPFLVNDERIPVWESFYSAAIAGLNRGRARMLKSGPLISRVSGSVS